MFNRRSNKLSGRSAAALLAATTIFWCAAAHTPVHANGSDVESLHESAKLVASDGASDDSFGSSISIDGDTAIVGAPHADTSDGIDAGAAYVFVGTGGLWTQQARLTASDGGDGTRFGFAVAIDGDTVIVTARGAELAYVFTRIDGVWTEEAKLSDAIPPPPSHPRWSPFAFGLSVSLSGDTATVGSDSYCLDCETITPVFGAGSVFVQSSGAWSKQAQLEADPVSSSGSFGISLSISGDTAIVGAPAQGAPFLTPQAHVFTRSLGGWTEEPMLRASDGPFFGFGVSVSIDRDTVIVGSPGKPDSGSAYIFTRSGGAWSEQVKLLSSDGAFGDRFGRSVAIDGRMAIVGADRDDEMGPDSGSAYLFVRSDVWSEQAKLLASDGMAGDAFGGAVAISGDKAIVGAAVSGSAYVFDFNRPPVCINDVTVQLWPPDHQHQSADLTTLANVSDPDGDALTLTVTGARQDEPVNGFGDGDTVCDVQSPGGTIVDVRRERAGRGDGRVYRISYTAADGNGGTCDGFVEFHVPSAEGLAAINSGMDVDASACLQATNGNDARSSNRLYVER